MTNYRRLKIGGGSYFFTLVTYQRQPWLCDEIARNHLRSAILYVQQKYPFTMDAIVLLPEHLHCIWTLPDGDQDYSIRWSLIKRYVTKQCRDDIQPTTTISKSRWQRREGTFWQRRFWEHWIRDEADFQRCCDYIHMNPVNHKLCDRPQDWPYSSIHRLTAAGLYPTNWKNPT
jgi:putative transposase